MTRKILSVVAVTGLVFALAGAERQRRTSVWELIGRKDCVGGTCSN